MNSIRGNVQKKKKHCILAQCKLMKLIYQKLKIKNIKNYLILRIS